MCAGENILMLSTARTYIMKFEGCRVKSTAAAATAVAAAIVLKCFLRLPTEGEHAVGKLKENSKLYSASTYHNPYIRHLRILLMARQCAIQ